MYNDFVQVESDIETEDDIVDTDQHEDSDLETASSTAIPDVSMIPVKAHQPHLSFPLRTFGKQRRAFCSVWYRTYPWLHYYEATDSVLCFNCNIAELKNLPITHNKDPAFSKLWASAIGRKHSKDSTSMREQFHIVKLLN